MSDKIKPDVIVIGAGIIGIIPPLNYRRSNSVTVLDRKGVAAEKHQQYAAGIRFADVIPLATPGIMRKAQSGLLDPLGPLSLRQLTR